MSRGAQIAIGVVALVCGASFAALALISGDLFPVGPWPFYGLAALCVALAAACFFRGSRPVTLRILGAVRFLTYLAYALGSLKELTAFRAIRAFCLWGLPSGYLAIHGGYPSWGGAAAAFGIKRRDAD